MDCISRLMDFDRRNAFAEADVLFRRVEGGADPMVYELAVKLYCKNGELDRAQEVLDAMLQRSVEPTLATFFFLAHGLCFYQRYSDLDRYFDRLLSLDASLLKEGRIQTPVFRAYREQGRWNDAWQLFERTRAAGFYLCSTAYVHFLTGMQESERYERSIESFAHQRNFERAVTDLHFALFLASLSRAGEHERVLQECELAQQSHPQWLGPFSVPPVSEASEALGRFEVALRLVSSLELDRAQLIRKDGVFSSLLRVLSHSSDASLLNALTTFALTDGLAQCSPRSLREGLLHLASKDEETVVLYFRHIIKQKSGLNPSVVAPFLESLLGQSKLQALRRIHEMLSSSSSPMPMHPVFLISLVPALSRLGLMERVDEVARSYGHTGVPSLQRALARAYDEHGQVGASKSFFRDYLENGASRTLDPSVVRRVCEVCLADGDRELYRTALLRYARVTGANADAALISALLDKYEKRFADEALADDIKRFLFSVGLSLLFLGSGREESEDERENTHTPHMH